jgi:hypothetical protein
MGVASDNDRSELLNLETMDYIAFPLTPHVISPSVTVNYTALGGVGASAERQVYANTGSEELQVEFPYYRVGLAHAGALTVEKATAAMAYHRDFVRSCTIPGKREDGLSTGSPALCLLTIPGVLTWRCRVRALKVDMRRGADLKLMELKLLITFREEWDSAMSSEDILAKGYQRG